MSDPLAAAAVTISSSVVSGVGTKLVTNYYESNKPIINRKIRQVVFRKKWDCSVYFSKFFKFKKYYDYEEINKVIVNSIKKFKVNQDKDCTYNVEGVLCNILPAYGFLRSDKIDNFFEEERFEMYGDESDVFNFPQVESVTIYISPLTTDKISYHIYQKIIYLIEKNILAKFDYKRTGSFIYFKFSEEKNLKKMEEYLQKKISKLNQDINIDKNTDLELKIINKPVLEKLIATLL